MRRIFTDWSIRENPSHPCSTVCYSKSPTRYSGSLVGPRSGLPERHESLEEEVSQAAQHQQAFVRLLLAAAQPAPDILHRLVGELERRVQGHHQFVEEHPGPRAAAL